MYSKNDIRASNDNSVGQKTNAFFKAFFKAMTMIWAYSNHRDIATCMYVYQI